MLAKLPKRFSVHLCTSTRHNKGKTYQCHLLRAAWREGRKVRLQTIFNVTHLSPAAREAARRSLNGEELARASEAFEVTDTTPHGDVAMVLAVLRQLGLERALHRQRSRQRDLVLALIVMRLLRPSSKLATARRLSADNADTTLGDLLELGEVSAEDLYAAQDWLLQRQPSIERSLARKHLHDGSLVLYDVTSTWYEGRSCPLASIGHSRDGRKNTLQIVFGLLCSADGCPVAVEVYEGNTTDPSTLSDQVAKVRERFGLQRVVFVGDCGLLTSARIDEELRPVEGLDWITALRSTQVRKLAADGGPLQMSLVDQTDLAELSHEDFPGERLIACLNPLLRDERRRKREELLQATEALLDQIVAATRRPQLSLRGVQRITESATLAQHKYKMAKHFDL